MMMGSLETQYDPTWLCNYFQVFLWSVLVSYILQDLDWECGLWWWFQRLYLGFHLILSGSEVIIPLSYYHPLALASKQCRRLYSLLKRLKQKQYILWKHTGYSFILRMLYLMSTYERFVPLTYKMGPHGSWASSTGDWQILKSTPQLENTPGHWLSKLQATIESFKVLSEPTLFLQYHPTFSV